MKKCLLSTRLSSDWKALPPTCSEEKIRLSLPNEDAKRESIIKLIVDIHGHNGRFKHNQSINRSDYDWYDSSIRTSPASTISTTNIKWTINCGHMPSTSDDPTRAEDLHHISHSEKLHNRCALQLYSVNNVFQIICSVYFCFDRTSNSSRITFTNML